MNVFRFVCTLESKQHEIRNIFQQHPKKMIGYEEVAGKPGMGEIALYCSTAVVCEQCTMDTGWACSGSAVSCDITAGSQCFVAPQMPQRLQSTLCLSLAADPACGLQKAEVYTVRNCST